MLNKRIKIKIEFEVNLDMVPGMFYDPADWENYAREVLERQHHYHPSVTIVSTESVPSLEGNPPIKRETYL